MNDNHFTSFRNEEIIRRKPRAGGMIMLTL